MEMSKTRTRDLAASLANAAGVPGLNTQIGFTPRNPVLTGNSGTDNGSGTPTTPTSSQISLAQIGRISTNDFSLTLPGAIFKALLTERDGRVLQSPQVRAVEGQKASLRLGDKIPFASGSFQPGFGGVGAGGISPLVSTQFQFAEVGVNVDILPKVHGPEEVSLHVELELSTVRERIDIGGLQQPVIGQRKIIHDIRMREGEVNLLGGLQSLSDSLTSNGFPGLSQVPILRRLFGSESKEKIETELAIFLVPHIVRSPEITPANLRGIAAGNDATVKLSYAPREEAPKPAAPVPAPVSAPGVTPGAAPAPQNPGFVPNSAAPPVKPSPESSALQPAVLFFQPANLSARVDNTLFVVLNINQGTDLFSAPMNVQYDPKVLKLLDVVQGNALSPEGQKLVFKPVIAQDKGTAQIELSRQPGTGGVNSSGPVVLFRFQALAKGTSSVSLPGLTLKNSKNMQIPASVPSATVKVE
jgi:general secretion pathway protein D